MKNIICIMLSLIIFSCSPKDSAKSDKIKIAVSIFPVSDIVKNIAGEKADVFFAVPAGANPHTFEPAPSEVKKIFRADYFIGIDKNFDGWMEKFISPGSSRYYLIKNSAFEKYSFNKDADHAAGHKEGKAEDTHDEHGENPHIWLTFRGAKIIAESVYKILSEKDKPNEEYYKKNYKKYSEKLDAADKTVAGKFKRVKFKKFIQWHPSWNYFAEDYGLEIAGVIESGHGTEVSVKKMKDLAMKSKRDKVKMIIVDLDLKSIAADSLAAETGGYLVRLDSMGSPDKPGRSDFIELMNYNSEIIYAGLNK